MNALYVQYGCGLSAPEQWVNYDVSPTLRVQKIPLAGKLLRKKLNVRFPDNVRYGDIIKGLPVADNSCDGVYCSHTLEHFALHDFRKALQNTYRILKPGGIFRCVVPDLEMAAKEYIRELESGNPQASILFLEETLLGMKERPVSVIDVFRMRLGGLTHLWMWDHQSLAEELRKAGFQSVRKCLFNDSTDPMFIHVEDQNRFREAVAIECTK